MPFAEHSGFEPPSSPDAAVWRYVDLPKFLSLLVTRSLYFSRVDKFEDPFEGYFGAANLALENVRFGDIPEEERERTGFDEQSFNSYVRALRDLRSFIKNNRATTFVNCWHLQEHESAAMWAQYIKAGDGICIKSRFNRLCKSLEQYNDFDIHIGKVSYLDYNKDVIPFGNLFFPFMSKRKSFEHEQELRLLLWTPQRGKNNAVDPSQNLFADQAGILVPVSLDELIEEVRIAPTAPDWFIEIVEDLVGRYGLTKPVLSSDLAAVPTY